MDLTIPATKTKPAGGFDYAMLDKTTAKFAQEKANEIWQRHERMVGDWIENARALDEVADAFQKERYAEGKDPSKASNKTFKEWVEQETPYSAFTVGKMRLAARRLVAVGADHHALSWADASELTSGNASESVIQAVAERISGGDAPTQQEIRQINRAAREMPADEPLPTPDSANKIARKTGKPQVASDGKLYVGLTEAEVEQGKEENRLDFGIIDGVRFFGSITMTPEQWVARESDALVEWSVTDPPPIREAAEWLKGLEKAWKQYAKTKAVNGHGDSRGHAGANR